jgi:hypothetical protein
MKHIARGSDLLFSFDEESHPTALNDCHLFMRMIVLRRDKKRFEAKATNHHSISDKHLSLYSVGYMLNRNRCPVQMLRQSNAMTVSVRLIV